MPERTGSGEATSSQQGNASAALFASAGYSAWALAYRDFPSELEPFAPLSSYVSLAQRLSSPNALPRPTMTNLNVTGLNPSGAEAAVVPHTLVPLPGGRTMAVLALLDTSMLEGRMQSVTSRTLPFERSLQAAIARLRRLPGGFPDVVACMVSGLPPLTLTSSGGAEERARATGESTAGGTGEPNSHAAELAFLRGLVERTLGIDVWLVSKVTSMQTTPHFVHNWLGEAVFVVPLPEETEQGRAIHQITLTFDSLGVVSTAGTESVSRPVDCGVTPDPAIAAVLSTFAVTVNQMLGHEVAFLNASLSGTALTSGNCTTLLGAGAGNAGDSGGGGEIHSACGCRVAECGFGVLFAEAIRFGAEADVGFVNAGAIRGGLVAGRAVKLGNILEAVPFLNEVVSLLWRVLHIQVPVHALRTTHPQQSFIKRVH